MNTELGAHPKLAVFMGSSGSWCFGGQHCRLQALTGSGMGPAASHAPLSYNFRDIALYLERSQAMDLPWL